MTYFRSKRTPIEEFKEHEDKRAQDMEIGYAIPEDHEDHNMEEPQETLETILEKDSHKMMQKKTVYLVMSIKDLQNLEEGIKCH